MSSPAAARSSIDPAEVERFSRIAAEWWDPRGKFAPLHKFNPVRLAFIRDQGLYRFRRDSTARRPFEGLRLLDIGCGGGLLSEPMTRLGFQVTGVDASERNIGTASAHAAEQGLDIDYRASTAEALIEAGEPAFDVILNMEVIEHVADPGEYLRSCAQLLKPGGVMAFDDYLWSPMRPGTENPLLLPKAAIDAFTTLFSQKIRIIPNLPLYQLYIQKNAQ